MTHNLVAVAGISTLSVIEGSLTLDETWSPYAQGGLRIVAPADLSIIDPRTSARVDLTWTYTPLGATVPAQTLTADLGIRSYEREQDGTVTLSLQSDETFLQDLLAWRSPIEVQDITNAREFIETVFQTSLPSDQAGFTLTLEPGPADGPIEEPFVRWAQTIRWWDYITAPLLPLSLRLWCDENRKFWLTDIDDAVAGTVTLSDQNSVVEATESIDRGGDLWADHVILEYWESLDKPWRISVNLGPGTQTRTLHVKIEANTPWNQFTNPEVAAIPARAILDRLQKRGRSVPITAVSDYTVRPGQAATVNVFDTPQTGRVQAVRWSYPADTMTVTTRDLTEV